MRKIRYSSGLKAVVLLLQTILTIGLVSGIFFLDVLFGENIVNLEDVQNHAFTESEHYRMLFKDAVREVLDLVEYKLQFETDGAYDPEKIVNIMAYEEQGDAFAGTLGAEDRRFRYFLVDLENWANDRDQETLRVESWLQMEEDGSTLHQLQTVYLGESMVQGSDKTVDQLGDMDYALQEQIVEQVSFYYGGYYDRQLQERSQQDPDLDTGSALEVEVESDFATEEMESSGQSEARGREVLPISEAEHEQILQESIRKIINGELYELKGNALLVVLEDLGLLDARVYKDQTVLQEKYMTVDAETILGKYQSGSITLSEMEQVYGQLESALEKIGKEVSTYKRLVNQYEKSDSNLRYWVYEESQGKSFTNMEGSGYGTDFVETGKSLGSYFYYSKDDIRLDTNVGGMEDAFYGKMEKRNGGHNGVIFVGMDTKFPYQDSFAEDKDEYERLQPWGMGVIVACFVCAVGILVAFVYFGFAAGRNSMDGDVHLTWLERMHTEFLFLGLALVVWGAGVVLWQIASYLPDADLLFRLMAAAGGLALVFVPVFMALYMSLVRRVKAHSLWQGSLTFWIGKGIQKAFRNWKPSVKILSLFVLHVAFTLLLVLVALAHAEEKNVVLTVLALYLLLSLAEGAFALREGVQRNAMIQGVRRIAGGELEYQIDSEELHGDNKAMGEALNTIGEGLRHAVDDSMRNERLKADLITNVSHDIKTPLTSIINYVDLLKREDLENERAKGYIEVLDAKSQRLKQLTEDLVEASKISSGNIQLTIERLDFVELAHQTAGEFDERFEAKGLSAVMSLPKGPVSIMADGRRLWRVLENIYGNVAKYAMPNTRVYVDMEVADGIVSFSIKNISEQPLNIDASELTERFIRGDVSRSTEGSGLGLSIAENLTKLMGGTFDIYLDGDLFKVTITFPLAQ